MRLNKRTIAACTATLALVGGGMAFAYFNTDDNTTGSTGGAYLSVDAPDDAVADLVPNAQQTFAATISNSDTAASHDVSSFNVWVQNVDGSGWAAQAVSGKPACTRDDFDVWYENMPGTVPAATDPSTPGTIEVEVTVQLAERPWDQTNCLNLSGVPFHLTVS